MIFKKIFIQYAKYYELHFYFNKIWMYVGVSSIMLLYFVSSTILNLIGYTHLTHSYLMSKDKSPLCDSCSVLLTINHFITECNKYNQYRNQSNISEQICQALGPNPQDEKNSWSLFTVKLIVDSATKKLITIHICKYKYVLSIVGTYFKHTSYQMVLSKQNSCSIMQHSSSNFKIFNCIQNISEQYLYYIDVKSFSSTCMTFSCRSCTYFILCFKLNSINIICAYLPNVSANSQNTNKNSVNMTNCTNMVSAKPHWISCELSIYRNLVRRIISHINDRNAFFHKRKILKCHDLTSFGYICIRPMEIMTLVLMLNQHDHHSTFRFFNTDIKTFN
ncbi:hypothetical protein AGLY_000419 [Aphis glycines]|uniref:Uncharacterized protein n=1 Tax=Aphis glycines TaxID=307491 RepID=A0A6G0U9I1_APHGL|nr:hypothetical protein AGLY_000419 [Aphis glycines]